MTKFKEKVGRNLRAARLKCGFTQVRVEELTGLTYRHYQDIETGRVNVTIETLCKLARAFNTNVSQLVKGICH